MTRDFDWEDGTAVVLRSFGGLVTAAIVTTPWYMGSRLGWFGSVAILLVLPMGNRLRAAVMLATFGILDLAGLADIPMAAPHPALAAHYGALGVNAWDIVGTGSLAAASLLLAVLFAKRPMPAIVRMSSRAA